MGIDSTKKQHVRSNHRSAPASDNVYLKLLVKLYRFLARRTDAKFNQIVLRRLFLSKANRPPVSVTRLARTVKAEGNKDKILVVVGTVTDDIRFISEFPKVTVAALRVTATARAKILKAGGEIITLDQLALRAPKGENTMLLRGSKNARKEVKSYGFGPHSHKVPKVLSTGRKFEQARGRRRSRGFKV
ncbi:ribosomal protein L18e/L15P [Lipomyces arxii]|uniref:60S ribosomal protein eL18 n=1 Tax=Lipomyces arxii TaxID=56418 RepID=UPI0034CFBED7